MATDKEYSLLTKKGFVADIVGCWKEWKRKRKDWEDIWKEGEERWLLHTKGKDDDWMTDTPPTETNIAVEGAFSEVKDALFGGSTGEYFDVKRTSGEGSLPMQRALLKLRLNKQIKLKKLFSGQYGLRQLLIKGAMVGMVTWKRMGGYTLQYVPQPNGDYITESVYKEDLIDRPDVRLLPLEDVTIEPGADCFEDAAKIFLESVPFSEVQKKWQLPDDALDEFPYPGSKEADKEKRRQDLSLPDGDVKRKREMVELLHCYKWCDESHIQKMLAEKQDLDEGGYKSPRSKDVMYESDLNRPLYDPKNDEREGMDEETETETKGEEKFYHIVIANQGYLLEAEPVVSTLYPDAFFMATYIPVDGEYYGLGIPYLVKGPQDELKDLLDLNVDNIKLRLYSMIKYKPISSVDKFILKIRPHGLIPDRSGNDVSFMEVPDATQSAMARETSLSFKIQEASHVNKIISGSGQQLPNKTATGASILFQQSGKAFKTIVDWIGGNTIVPILERVYALDRQFTPPSQIFKLLGEKAAMEWSQMPPDQMFADAEFEFLQATELVSNEFKARSMIDMFNIGSKFPWMNAPQLMRDYAIAIGQDPEKYIFPPELLQQQGPPTPPPGLGVPQPNSPLGATNSGAGTASEFTQPGANGGSL